MPPAVGCPLKPRPPQLSPVQRVHATLSLVRSSRCAVAPAALQPLSCSQTAHVLKHLVEALVSPRTAVLLGQRACSGTTTKFRCSRAPRLPGARWGSEFTSLSSLKTFGHDKTSLLKEEPHGLVTTAT